MLPGQISVALQQVGSKRNRFGCHPSSVAMTFHGRHMIPVIQTLTSQCGRTRNHSRLPSTRKAGSKASSCDAGVTRRGLSSTMQTLEELWSKKARLVGTRFPPVGELAGILGQVDLSGIANSSARRLMMRNIVKQFPPRSARDVFT